MRNLRSYFPFLIILSTVVLSNLSAAQRQFETRTVSGRDEGKSEAKKGGTEAQQKMAKKMLEQAAAETAKYDAESRAYLDYQVARGMGKYDKAGAQQKLRDAFTATRSIDDKSSKEQLQGWIVEELMSYGPQLAEELMPQAEGEARKTIRSRLIEYYTNKKDFDRAEELVRGVVSSEEPYPYKAVAKLMNELPPERSGERVSLFSEALADYQQRGAEDTGIGSDDMGTFLARYGQQLPTELAREAIDEVLKRAKEESQDKHLNIGISNGKQAANFSSIYEYRLFQVLPTLRVIDPERAEELLKEDQQLNSSIQSFPSGMQSVSPEYSGNPKPNGQNVSMSVQDDDRAKGPDAEMQQQLMISRRVEEIVKAAKANPKQALAAAESLPKEQNARLIGLAAVARELETSAPTYAKTAAEDIVNGMEDVRYNAQTMYLQGAVAIFEKIGDNEGVEKAVKKGLERAAKRHDKDEDAGDPDKAARPFWPSAGMYKTFVPLAGKVSTKFGMDAVNGIDDAEVQTFARIMLADSWLGVPPGLTVMKEVTASGDSTSIMDERDN